MALLFLVLIAIGINNLNDLVVYSNEINGTTILLANSLINQILPNTILFWMTLITLKFDTLDNPVYK